MTEVEVSLTITAAHGYAERRIPDQQETYWRQEKARSSSILPPSIPPSSLLEYAATTRFFYHYLSPHRSLFQLDLNLVSGVLREAGECSAVAEAIISMGIMTLPGDPRIKQRAAMIRYGRALRFTNRMLLFPERAASDETLLVVILLGLYETIPGSLETSYQAQIRGALSLLQLRPSLRTLDAAAYRMFNYLRIQIITRCFQFQQPVPPEIVRFSEDAGEWQKNPTDRAADQLILMFARLSQVLADAKTMPPDHTLQEAKALRSWFLTWPSTLPEEFFHTSVQAQSLDICYSCICYIYKAPFYAEAWTLYRVGLCTITSLLIAMSPDSSMDYATDNIAVLQAICATIPFSMDCHGSQPKRTADLPLRCRTPAMNYLQFVLQFAGSPQDMRDWAERLIRQLQGDSRDDFAIGMDRLRGGTDPPTSNIMQ